MMRSFSELGVGLAESQGWLRARCVGVGSWRYLLQCCFEGPVVRPRLPEGSTWTLCVTCGGLESHN